MLRVCFWVCALGMLLLTQSCYQYPPIQGTIINKHIIKKNTKTLDINKYIPLNNTKNNILEQSFNVIDENLISRKRTILPLFWYKYYQVGILDSLKLIATINNISEFIKSKGFYANEVGYKIDTISVHHKKKQVFVNIKYFVTFKSPYFINNIKMDFVDFINKYIAKNEFLLVGNNKNEVATFSTIEQITKNIISAHKDLGFYTIGNSNIKVELDTSINQYASRNKYVDLRFFYSLSDSVKLKQFIINDVNFYDIKDTVQFYKLKKYKNINYDSVHIKLVPNILYDFNTLKKNDYFKEKNYNEGLKNLYSLNVWSAINIDSKIIDDTVINSKDTIGRINFNYWTERYKKYSIGSDFGLGYNFYSTNTQTLINQNSIALALSGNFVSRNNFNRAIESRITLRTAIETFLNDIVKSKISTLDVLGTYTQQIPWMFPTKKIKINNAYISTNCNLGLGYINRLDYFTMKKVLIDYSWKIQNADKNLSITLQPAVLSIILLDKKDLFVSTEAQNPYLKYAFNEGVTMGLSAGLTKSFIYNQKKQEQITSLNFYAEESGAVWGYVYDAIIKSIKGQNQLFNYLKFDASVTHTIKRKKTALAFRLRGGFGYSYGNDTLRNQTLPFFKQFAMGGPNSMRGWNFARLGLGTSKSINDASFKDRYGDIMLEGNVEYRFNLFKIYSVQVESAVFVDVGNIWNRKPIQNESNESVFKLSKLQTDLAIATGTGLRFNFSFLLIRLDFGWKLKDPILENVEKSQFTNPFNKFIDKTTFQLGLGYAF